MYAECFSCDFVAVRARLVAGYARQYFECIVRE